MFSREEAVCILHTGVGKILLLRGVPATCLIDSPISNSKCWGY